MFESGKFIGKLYDQQAIDYIRFAEQSYTWNHLERPAFDHYIPHFYNPNTIVLDLACGTGRVIRHLVSKGVDPRNIVGVDVSEKLLSFAAQEFPEATFLLTSVDEINLPTEHFDLVTSNMMIHFLDNPSLYRMLESVYQVLKPNGVYFFVESDPDHNEESRAQENLDKWLMQPTPWGTMMPYFNRDPRTLLTNYLDISGFDYQKGWMLKLSESGRVDLKNIFVTFQNLQELRLDIEKLIKESKI